MCNSIFSLTDFAYSVPTCQPETESSSLLTIFLATKHRYMAIVDRNDHLVGVVSDRSLYARIIESARRQQQLESQDDLANNLCLSNSDVELPIESPIVLSAQMSASESIEYFKLPVQNNESTPIYVLVDAREKFVGILDSEKLIKFLLLDRQNILESNCQLIIESWQKWSSAILEQFPLPLSLQTQEGKTIYENICWQEQIGKANYQNALLYFQTAKACLENSVNWQQSAFSRTIVENERTEKQDWQTTRLPLQQIPIASERHGTTEWEQSESELAVKNAELVAINRLKDELLATLSHELKSPLTAILGLSSLLKEQKLGQLNQRQNRYMELIHNSARQLMSLVNDLLDLARLETGQLQLSLETLDIKTVCENAYKKTVETLFKKKQRSQSDLRPKFTLTIEPGLEIVRADELRLGQMLVNLLDNAHKFTADGEIGLVVEHWSNYVAFTVWDNGVGIPEESQSSILRRFSGVEDYRANSINGKGLGLILTQKLALAHGGDISFISKVGRGSEFTLLLPVDGDRDKEYLTSERSIDKSKNYPWLTNSKELVLVVEEVACELENLTFNLKGLGYHVVVARTEVEALEKARQLQPDKILLNLNSSSFSGWDVLTLLKSDPALKDIPAIAIAPELAKQKAKSNGANGFLSLPIEREALREIFPPLSRDNRSDRTSLQILHLYPEADAIKSLEDRDNNRFELIFRNYLSSSHHRIIEADSLEQADLLTHIWNLDVVVIDGSILKAPLEYLRSLKEHHALASLPLVILDAKTTKIANQLSNLSVFPCLLFDREQNLTKVLEVIEIAAKAKNS